MSKQLTTPQRAALRKLEQYHGEWLSNGELGAQLNTTDALLRRGLVEQRSKNHGAGGWRFEWRINEAGKKALGGQA